MTAVSARRVWIVVLVVMQAIGLSAFVLGLSPWLAPVVALISLTLAIGQRSSWPFAIVASTLLSLAVVAVYLKLTPSLGLGLVTPVALLLLVLTGAGVAVLAFSKLPRLPSKRMIISAGAVCVVIVGFAAVIIIRAIPRADFEWSMHNDAVWNLVTTRFIIADGGVDTNEHPSSSPLTAMLMAIGAAVGRAGKGATELLSHDIVAFASFILLATGFSCFLAGILGFRSVPKTKPVLRWVAAILLGILPSTWFVMGVATSFGFYNVTLAVVLLIATWLVWQEARTRPLDASLALAFASVCLLATWAPLAIIPVGMAIVIGARVVRESFPKPRSEWARSLGVYLMTLAPVVLYGLFVTIADLGRDGAALAVEGAFIPFLPVHLFVIAMVAMAASLMVAGWLRRSDDLIGTTVVLGAGAIGLAYLVYQRRDVGSLWGYYPAKYAWFVAILLLLILAATMAKTMGAFDRNRLAVLGSAALIIVLPISLMAHIPPRDGWRTAVTPIAIGLGLGPASPSNSAESLFAIAESGVPTIVVNYGGEHTDRFINSWLLQLESESSNEPIRNFSYFLEPGDEIAACDAITTWDRNVRVVTSDPGLQNRLKVECAAAEFFVELREAPGPSS